MSNRARSEVKVKCAIIDTRHVTGSTGLVFLRLESKRVHVNASCGDIAVVLVRLHEVEIASVAFREAIVAVELNLCSEHGVLASIEERCASGVDKAVPACYTKRLVVATPWKVASGRAAAAEHVLHHTWVEPVVTGRVNLRDTLAHRVPSTAVGVAALDEARAGVGTSILLLCLLVLVVESLVLEAFLTRVVVALVDAAGLVEVDVLLVAGLGPTVVALVVGEALAGTVLCVGEAGALAVGFAFVTASSTAGTFVSRAEGVVVGAGEFAAFRGATSHVTKPLVCGRIPVAVEVDCLVGKAKIEVLGVDHAATERIIGRPTEVGNVNGIGEVEVLWATVGEG